MTREQVINSIREVATKDYNKEWSKLGNLSLRINGFLYIHINKKNDFAKMSYIKFRDDGIAVFKNNDCVLYILYSDIKKID